MNRLREMTNLEKDAATHIHTRLVNQVDTLWKYSPLVPSKEELDPPSSKHDRESTHFNSNLKRDRSLTSDDDERFEDSGRS